jgi:hypothetical protein
MRYVVPEETVSTQNATTHTFWHDVGVDVYSQGDVGIGARVDPELESRGGGDGDRISTLKIDYSIPLAERADSIRAIVSGT